MNHYQELAFSRNNSISSSSSDIYKCTAIKEENSCHEVELWDMHDIMYSGYKFFAGKKFHKINFAFI